MNHEHLMKFRLRQMEREIKSTLKKKITLQNLMVNLYKTIIRDNRPNLIEDKIDND